MLARPGAMDVTKPYKFTGFGAMDVTKPHKFMGFVARSFLRDPDLERTRPDPAETSKAARSALVSRTRPRRQYRCLRNKRPSQPYEFIGIGAMDVTKPYKYIYIYDLFGSSG